jgi:type III secretion protein C
LLLLQRLIELWDRPVPQIKIEAHIFETNESDALKLGLEFSGRGLADGGMLSAGSGESYAFDITLGPQDTSQGMRIEATLRFLQSKGRGRVLSRPLVVTANNIEAEMNSGSVINIRLTGEKTASLQEIKTGVTLRVTPRLIPNPGDNRSQDEILLNVYAETSIPMAESNIDGIPQINSQRARSEVIVRQGQPFLIGGLIKERESMSQFGVPLLKDLPLIGWLFRSEGNASQFDHVLVFITPTRLDPVLTHKLPDLNMLQKPLKASTER